MRGRGVEGGREAERERERERERGGGGTKNRVDGAFKKGQKRKRMK